ncbi:MAG TPA: hypothetical protein VFR78_04010 [Pyrinomonadaceae bacterium]|nr:hypothetical protein [Pyrinomonadaceae bacterium]
MAQEQPTVSDIFRQAQALRQDHPDWSYKQIQEQLVKSFSGGPFPSLHTLTIPEQDARAPEEDWTAGLPIVRRGIQFEDWNEVIQGILLSLEQTENYERARGPEGSRDDWHDRSVGISEAVEKGVGKWMPDELLALAERKGKKT